MNKRYFIKSDYMNELADYFDILIRASWQVFEHLSLDSCLLKDLFFNLSIDLFVP